MDGIFLNLLPPMLISNFIDKVQTETQLSTSENDELNNELKDGNNFYQLITYLLAQVNGMVEVQGSCIPGISGNSEGEEVSNISLNNTSLNNSLNVDLPQGRLEPVQKGDEQLGISNSTGTLGSVSGEVLNIDGEVLEVDSSQIITLSSLIELQGNSNVIADVKDASGLSKITGKDTYKEFGQDTHVINSSHVEIIGETKTNIDTATDSIFKLSNKGLDSANDTAGISEVLKYGSANLAEETILSGNKVLENVTNQVIKALDEKNDADRKVVDGFLESRPNSTFLSSVHSHNKSHRNIGEPLIELFSPQVKENITAPEAFPELMKEKIEVNEAVSSNSIQHLLDTNKVAEIFDRMEMKVIDKTLRWFDDAINKLEPTREVFNKVVDFIQLHKGEEVKSVLVRLKPEYLGELNIKVNYVQGEVSIRLSASSQDVQKLLLGNVQQLRDFLKQDGIPIQEIHVVSSGVWQGMGNQHSGMGYQPDESYGYGNSIAIVNNEIERDLGRGNTVQGAYHNGNINLLA